MATRRKPRSTEWVEVPLDEPNEPWWNTVSGMVPLEGQTVALNIDFVKLVILEAQPSGTPRTLSVPTLAARPVRVHFLPEWPLLAVFSDESLELLDVSDPRAPKQVRLFEYEQGHERAITSMGEDLYVTHENGVAWLDPASRKPQHLFDVPNDKFFGSYPTALTAAGDFLYVVGRHAGLHVYRRTARTDFTLVRSTQRGYAPTSCHWWAPGVLLLVGNEDVIAVDVSVPEKAKLSKSCKLTKLDIDGPLCRLDGHHAFVAGPNVRTGDLTVATLDLSEPLAPQVTETHLLGDATLDWRSSRAIRVGDQIFAGTVYVDRLHVFRKR